MADVRTQMFGDSSEAVATGGTGFKAFVSLKNVDKDPKIFQHQLASLAATMASFDALGYDLEDLTLVSKTLVEKEAYTIKDLVNGSQLFNGENPKWAADHEPAARGLAEFLQKY